eukprot:NODE_13_length_54415_cov_0.522424.p16 type:complete len:348 gc:universal NODE_13_length_54415_cov_0.522424:47170-48213(+)
MDLDIPENLTPVLRKLVQEILVNQPSDIVQFCADYFNGLLREQRQGKFENKIEAPQQQEDDLMDEFESDDDIADDEPPVQVSRGRRVSVSAESMQPETNFEKIIIPKSDQQKARLAESVQQNFLFRNLDEDQSRDVINAMEERIVKPEEVIIRQGDEGDFFYVVESGKYDIFVNKNGTPVKVVEIGAGGSFGELALMYNATRAATVVATSPGVLWALDRVTFRRILMDNTSKKRKLYESFLEEVPLLHSLEVYERHKIADTLETVSFQDGDTVIKQGDIGDSFYIIEEGEAVVTKVDAHNTTHVVRNLKKGDYFGGSFYLQRNGTSHRSTSFGNNHCKRQNQMCYHG